MEAVQSRIIRGGRYEALVEEEGHLITQLEERHYQEEALWRYSDLSQWLREGERNSKCFHRSMNSHRQHNRIMSLAFRQGAWMEAHNDMEWESIFFFSKLLSEEENEREEYIE